MLLSIRQRNFQDWKGDDMTEQELFDDGVAWFDRLLFWVRVSELLKEKGMRKIASIILANSFRLAA